MGGVARRYRRQFIAQLPEFVQLVSAQMSANVSMEEALRRTAQAQSLVGKWMRWVLQMAQGRDLIEQMQREAQESHLPELIGMSVQLEFIRRGTAQQELMGQLAEFWGGGYRFCPPLAWSPRRWSERASGPSAGTFTTKLKWATSCYANSGRV